MRELGRKGGGSNTYIDPARFLQFKKTRGKRTDVNPVPMCIRFGIGIRLATLYLEKT